MNKLKDFIEFKSRSHMPCGEAKLCSRLDVSLGIIKKHGLFRSNSKLFNHTVKYSRGRLAAFCLKRGD